MRTNYSVKNSITSVMLSVMTLIVGFVSRAIFIRIMSAEYLGLNGLFSNVLSILSIFELGIGNAIVYNLYKPVANNNTNEIKALMKFYKKSYNIIALVVFAAGLLLIPFLSDIVGKITIDININIIYLLFLINTASSYIIAYKRSLIYANQKNYIINIIHMAYVIILNIVQLLVLFFTKNYYLYLISLLVCRLIENIAITIIANKLYPLLKEKSSDKLNKKIEKNIFSKVKALFFHKIGEILVLGTDNIIISSFLGIIYVGLYSNYLIIISSINTLVSQIIDSTLASVGNLLVTENNNKAFSVFKKMRFFNFWLACFTAISIFVMIQPFIKVWLGKEYLLNSFVVIILVINYYQKAMRQTYVAFKNASGTWEEDKFVPLIESALNVGFSIAFLKIFGLAGVFMGTIISGLALWCFSYPKFVYKKLFNRSYIDYAKETIGYILLFGVIITITYLTSLLFMVNSAQLQVIINAIICLIIPNFILFILFRKTDNFQYFVILLKKMFNKFRIKSRKLKRRSK